MGLHFVRVKQVIEGKSWDRVFSSVREPSLKAMTSSAPEPQPEKEAGGASARAEKQPESSAEVVRKAGALALPSVPDHELLRCIGRGAYGAVWLARNVMGTYRAVKLVQGADFDRDRPFTREYEGLLKFEPVSRSHPNLMQILHVGRREGYFYYVTELADDANAEGGTRRAEQVATVEGGGRKAEASGQWSVISGQKSEARGQKSEVGGQRAEVSGQPDDRIQSAGRLFSSVASYVPRTVQEDLQRRGRLPMRECLRVAVALASALKHLHDHHLVHRDVKPSNVIFVHGVSKLADIGLVATVDDSRSIVGTEGYLPPEGPGSAPADLYSLGKLLYEISTGMSRSEYPRLPPNLRDLPDAEQLLEFNEVLLRACARDTERRYHSADDLLADLALLERGDSVKRLRRLERHHVLLKRVGVTALGLVLLISVAWWESWRAERIANRHLAQVHVTEGTRRMVEGDYAAALPWLVGALQLDSGNPERERAHRLRIASVLERCPFPVACFSAPDSPALSADINPEGTLVATAHADGVVRLWNTRSGRQVQPELRDDFPVVRCQFQSGGRRLLTVTLGQRVHLWDLDKPTEDPLTFPQAMGTGSDGYSLDLNSALQQTLFWKSGHGGILIRPFTEPFENLTLSLKLTGHGDSLLAQYEIRRTGQDGDILDRGEFLDTPRAEPLKEGSDDPPEPAWGRVWVSLQDSSLGEEPGQSSQIRWDNPRVRSYPSGKPATPWRTLDDFEDGLSTNWIHAAPTEVRSNCRTEDGHLVVTGSNLPLDQFVWPRVAWIERFELSPDKVLEAEVDLISARAPHPSVGLSFFRALPGPGMGPDRPFLSQDRWCPLEWWGGTIRIGDFAEERLVTTQVDGRESPLELRNYDKVLDFTGHPQLRFVAVMGSEKRCAVWDVATGAEIMLPAPEPRRDTDARFSPDARFLAVSHVGGIDLIRTMDWQVERRLEPGASIGRTRFSPKGGRLAAVRGEREVVVWDLGDPGKPPARFSYSHRILHLVFSPDGRYLATGSENDMVQMWDLLQGERFGPPLPGSPIRFSADGSQLLTLGNEGRVWLWELSRLAYDPIAVPSAPAVRLSAASPDETMTARLRPKGIELNTPTGQYTLELPALVPLNRLAFSSDNCYLLADSSDLRLWVWDIATRTLAAPARPARYEATLENHLPQNLPAENHDRRTLSDLAALLGEQRPDSEGGMVPVAGTARARLLAELKKVYPAEFDVNNSRLKRWHQTLAEEAEQAMTWDAALFHWEEVMKRQSDGNNQKSGNSCAARLAYARQAHEVVQAAIGEGRSRWSVILPRPPLTTNAMLDLTDIYNRPLGQLGLEEPTDATFRDLTSGIHVLGGTGFDVRGIIHLGFTNRVTIPLDRACARLHFLHASSGRRAGVLSVREKTGSYQVTYASGRKATVTMFNPDDLPPYSEDASHEKHGSAWDGTSPGLRCVRAWCGSQPAADRVKRAVFLTRTTWTLPSEHRGEIVSTLELQAGPAESAPLIFAITIE